jgi:hypothetical protein
VLVETRLTKQPTDEGEYLDPRVEWGAERCYSITTVHIYEGLPVESALAPPSCVKLIDTFPPPAPTGVTAIESEGAVTLIWDPSPSTDLAGYIVLRGDSGADALVPLTTPPIQSTQFTDTSGGRPRFVYVVQAVDRTGNVSEASAPVEAAAR